MDREMSGTSQYDTTIKNLQAAMKVSPSGVDYWLARDISGILGYTRWENFQEAIKRAMNTCETIGATPSVHFRETTKVIKAGKGANMNVPDFFQVAPRVIWWQ